MAISVVFLAMVTSPVEPAVAVNLHIPTNELPDGGSVVTMLVVVVGEESGEQMHAELRLVPACNRPPKVLLSP